MAHDEAEPTKKISNVFAGSTAAIRMLSPRVQNFVPDAPRSAIYHLIVIAPTTPTKNMTAAPCIETIVMGPARRYWTLPEAMFGH